MSIRLFEHQDKVAHALMFGGLCIAWGADRLRRGISITTRGIILTATLSLMLGIVIEGAQYCLHTGRSAEWGDVAADATGCILAAIALVYFTSWLRSSHNH